MAQDDRGDLDWHAPEDEKPFDMSPVGMDVTDPSLVEPPTLDPNDHWQNLAGVADQGRLAGVIDDLTEAVERDLQAREPWVAKITKAMDALGFDPDETRSNPFPGASAVHHPLFSQACVEFMSRTGNELLPQSGPVECISYGDDTQVPGLSDRKRRVKSYANWLATAGMEDYVDGYDQLLMALPVMGSVFRMVSWGDDVPSVENIPAMDFVVPWNTKSLRSAPRKTRILRLHAHEVQANINSGLWREVPLGTANEETTQATHGQRFREKLNKISGLQKPGDAKDDRFVVYETHCLANLEDDSQDVYPYIVAYEPISGEVLSVTRNWDPEDPKRREIRYFVHYRFLPNVEGFYGLSLFHLIGGLTKAATGTLRALMDAAALSNSAGGLVDDKLKIVGENVDLDPFTITKVKTPEDGAGRALTSYFQKAPFNGPDPTLFQMLGQLEEAGQSFVSIDMADLGGQNNAAPVGTTMGMVEQKGIIPSGIHRRTVRSMSAEWEIIQDVLHRFGDEDMVAQSKTDGLIQVSPNDFDGSVLLVSMSDPKQFSDMQRITKAQSSLQLAQTAAQMGVQADARTLVLRMASALGDPNPEKTYPDPKAAPPPPPPPRMNPMEQFQAILRMQPVNAYAGQDHQAHVTFLSAMIGDQQYAPFLDPAKRMPAIQALICEHLALFVADQVSQQVGSPIPPSPGLRPSAPTPGAPGAPPPPQVGSSPSPLGLPKPPQASGAPAPGGASGGPPPGQQQLPQQLPPQLEFAIAQRIAQAGQVLAQQSAANAPQGQAGAAAMDPAKTALDAKALQQKGQSDQQKLQLEGSKLMVNAQLKREEIASRERIAGANIAAKDAHAQLQAQTQVVRDALKPPPAPPGPPVP